MANSDFSSFPRMLCEHCGVSFPKPSGDRDARRRKYCGKQCSMDALHASKKIPLKDRFWCHVDMQGPNQCWPWTRRLDPKGYGRTTDDNRKGAFAHRAAYMLTNGPIPDGLVIRHSCDNPACCNPKHLDVGTQADNIMDMLVRQRHTPTKIPLDIAWKMREDSIAGLPTKDIAQKYGFERSTIKQLMRRGRAGLMPPVPVGIRSANGVKNQVKARTRPLEIDGAVYQSVEAARVSLKRATKTIKKMLVSGEAKYV